VLVDFLLKLMPEMGSNSIHSKDDYTCIDLKTAALFTLVDALGYTPRSRDIVSK
jgi:hypothetical protein